MSGNSEEQNIFSLSMRCTRGCLNTYKLTPIPARILWPALGFPAVIDPENSSKADDASTCVSVVIVSNKQHLTRKQAAEHLRFVPWKRRRTRFLPTGPDHGFTEDEIEVRSNPDYFEPRSPPGLFRYGKSDEFVQQLYFGYDANVKNGFTAGLSWYVLKQYAKWWKGHAYLHEIRASRAASSRLAANPQYNLFWINSNPDDTEADISDELDLLIKHYAAPNIKTAVDTVSKSTVQYYIADDQPFLHAYEYDYTALNAPYTKTLQLDKERRTEVLHPLFVKTGVDHLKIGHLTDLHVATRNDVYDDNLKGDPASRRLENWNTSVRALYKKAKDSCDVLLLTGDLIDYGRGHVGIQAGQQLGIDALYLVDRNWLLFYSLLASTESYEKPSYTILGNHDWRLNPYPPFAPGAPDPRSMTKVEPTPQYWTKENKEDMDDSLKEFLKKAHGDGWEKGISYFYPATDTLNLLSEEPGVGYNALAKLWNNAQTLNIPHLPTETNVESIAWYLLLINPFLDYSFHLAGGYDILMLDWAQYEDLFFPIVENGKERPYHLWEAKEATNPGPMAKACLTDLQKELVKDFVGKPGKAKILGIHAPPIGPYNSWSDDLLYSGQARFNFPPHDYDKSHKWPGKIFAIAPKDGLAGHEASYNSFVKHREWLITNLDANVRLVLAGHIHRNGVFVVDIPTGEEYRRAYLVDQNKVTGAHQAPLYVNTTSAGPRGHLFDVDGNDDTYIDSGYAVIDLSSDGTLRAFAFLSAATP